jgi:hypothetical protein
MTARSGATLVEVLIAIFIMAIGMLALLAVFPVGALSMAEAIQRERSAECALNGDAAANMQIYRNAVYTTPIPPNPGPPPGNACDIRTDAYITPYYTMTPSATVDPTPGGLAPSGPLPDLTTPPYNTSYTNPGYPVLVDPVGFNLINGLTVPSASPAGPSWVGNMDGATAFAGGNMPPPSIRRVNVQMLCNANFDAMLGGAVYKTQKTLRWSALLDDMTFISDSSITGGTALGLPCPPGGTVERDDRYTWAYLLRPPSNKTTDFTATDISIVVYSGRSFAAVDQEHPYPATFDPNTNVITLSWRASDSPPTLRRGNWVLDATNVPNYSGTISPTTLMPHGYFYRVVRTTERVDLTDPVTPNKLDLEIQGQLRGYTAITQGWIVIMDNVVDVFERLTF